MGSYFAQFHKGYPSYTVLFSYSLKCALICRIDMAKHKNNLLSKYCSNENSGFKFHYLCDSHHDSSSTSCLCLRGFLFFPFIMRSNSASSASCLVFSSSSLFLLASSSSTFLPCLHLSSQSGRVSLSLLQQTT